MDPLAAIIQYVQEIPFDYWKGLITGVLMVFLWNRFRRSSPTLIIIIIIVLALLIAGILNPEPVVNQLGAVVN